MRLAGPGQVVSIDLTEGAGIGGWDIRAGPSRPGVRSCAGGRRPTTRPCAITRRRWPSHAAGGEEKPSDAPASIHDIVLTKEAGLADRLHYDPYERRSGLVRFLAPGTTPADWAEGKAVELGDAIDGAYELTALEPGRVVVERDGDGRRRGRPRDEDHRRSAATVGRRPCP